MIGLKKGILLIIVGIILLVADVTVMQVSGDTPKPEFTLEYMIPGNSSVYESLDYVRFLCRDLESGIEYVGVSVWQKDEVGDEFLLTYSRTIGQEQPPEPAENETEPEPPPPGSFTVTFKTYYYIDPISDVRVYFGPQGGSMDSKVTDDAGEAIWHNVSGGEYEYSATWLTLVKEGVLTVDGDERVSINFWRPGMPIQVASLESLETWEIWDLHIDPPILETGEYNFQFFLCNNDGLKNAIPVETFSIVATGDPSSKDENELVIGGEPTSSENQFHWVVVLLSCGLIVSGVLVTVSERRRWKP